MSERHAGCSAFPLTVTIVPWFDPEVSERTHMRRITTVGLFSLMGAALLLGLQPAADSGEKRKSGPGPAEVRAVLDKALDYLKTSQIKDGSFAPKIAGPGVTGVVIAGLARNGVSPKEPVV